MPGLDLLALMRAPQLVGKMLAADWNQVAVQARKAQLLGQLAAHFERAGVLALVPAAVRRHLDLELLTSKRRAQAALWEVSNIRRTVPPEIPLVLLKGCAYVASGDNNAAGRLFSDVDLLVSRSHLAEAETQLLVAGWKPKRVNDYDGAYYRNWMHEVPPMEHVRRHTVIDLHHAINPPISRYYVPPDSLLARLELFSPGIFVLCATDRVIHCALHLLQEGEPKKIARDLFDLYLLAQQHCGDAAGWQALQQRVQALKLEKTVFTAITAARELFGDVTEPGFEGMAWLKNALLRAGSMGLGTASASASWSNMLLLAYSHWVKMPWPILLPHLLRKFIAGFKTEKED